MKISNNYVVVEKIVEPEKEGFQTVEVQDSFIYKGRITNLPEIPVYVGNTQIQEGTLIMFAKYSPDTQETMLNGKTVKFVKTSDILATL